MLQFRLHMLPKSGFLAPILCPWLLRQLDKLILPEAQYLVETVDSGQLATLEHGLGLLTKLRQLYILTRHWIIHYVAHLVLVKFTMALLQLNLHGNVHTFGR